MQESQDEFIECTTCKETLPSNSFSNRQLYRKTNQCKKCVLKMNQTRQEHSKNAEKQALRSQRNVLTMKLFSTMEASHIDMEILPSKLPNIRRYRLKEKYLIECHNCLLQQTHYSRNIAIKDLQVLICNACYHSLIKPSTIVNTRKRKAEYLENDISKPITTKTCYIDGGYQLNEKKIKMED